MCIYMCVEVVLINVLALRLTPPNKNSWLRPFALVCLYGAISLYIYFFVRVFVLDCI